MEPPPTPPRDPGTPQPSVPRGPSELRASPPRSRPMPRSRSAPAISIASRAAHPSRPAARPDELTLATARSAAPQRPRSSIATGRDRSGAPGAHRRLRERGDRSQLESPELRGRRSRPTTRRSRSIPTTCSSSPRGTPPHNAMQQAAATATVGRALTIQQSKTQLRRARAKRCAQAASKAASVKVKRATSAARQSRRVLIRSRSVRVTVQPGDPYLLAGPCLQPRQQAHRREVGSSSSPRSASRTMGKGQQLQPDGAARQRRGDTSMIWEVPGTWSDEQNQGSIEAVVTLIGDAKLLKTIQWQ